MNGSEENGKVPKRKGKEKKRRKRKEKIIRGGGDLSLSSLIAVVADSSLAGDAVF